MMKDLDGRIKGLQAEAGWTDVTLLELLYQFVGSQPGDSLGVQFVLFLERRLADDRSMS